MTQRDELEAQQASVLDRQGPLAVRLVEDEGMTMDEILAEYPDLERADVPAALRYVAPPSS